MPNTETIIMRWFVCGGSMCASIINIVVGPFYLRCGTTNEVVSYCMTQGSRNDVVVDTGRGGGGAAKRGCQHEGRLHTWVFN